MLSTIASNLVDGRLFFRDINPLQQFQQQTISLPAWLCGVFKMLGHQSCELIFCLALKPFVSSERSADNSISFAYSSSISISASFESIDLDCPRKYELQESIITSHQESTGAWELIKSFEGFPLGPGLQDCPMHFISENRLLSSYITHCRWVST